MENEKRKVGGVASLWKIIVGSLVFVSLTATSWHLGEMRRVHEREQKVISAMNTDLTLLRGYRDAVKKEGIAGGKAYLTNPLNGTYGF